jgi:hypothetical protein
MKSHPRVLLLIASLSCLPMAAACGGGSRVLTPVISSATLAGIARVKLEHVDGGDLTLAVSNDSASPILVDRDAIFLVGPHGKRQHLPGDSEPRISVPPGSTQEVRVSFEIDDLNDGNHVQIVLADALTANGKRLSMPALRLRVPPE